MKWDMWLKFNAGRWKKSAMLSPSLQLQRANIRSKKKLATLTGDCRADTTLYILQMHQRCPPPELARALHSISPLSVAIIPNTAAEIPARAVLLLPPLLTVPTSTSQPSAGTSRGSSLVCLQCRKPRNRDLGLGCLWHVNLFTCVCEVGADFFCSPPTYHLMQTPLNGGSHRALTLTCVVAKKATTEKN